MNGREGNAPEIGCPVASGELPAPTHATVTRRSVGLSVRYGR